MVKKIVIILIILALGVAGFFVVKGIINNVKNITNVSSELPDFPDTPNEKESWEYWTDEEYDDGEIIDVDWYFSYPIGFSWSGNNNSLISSQIKGKTGCNLKIRSAVSDLSELTAMISGNQLPDVITIYAVNNPTWVDLVESGQVYALTDLSEHWAPNFAEQFSSEYQNYYSGSDGKWYGIPSLYYDKDSMDYYEDQGGSYLPNGTFCAREDMLNWYLENYPTANPTTPKGFIEMCKIVRDECPLYKAPNTYSTVQFSQFSADTLNTSMRWLAQYFAVPKEDAEGNLLYLEAEEGYLECLEFANELYREGLIKDSTFTDTTSQINANISKGYPFVIFGSYAEFNSGYYNWNCNLDNEDKQYVPIVITNSNGDAPVLQDVTGTGMTVTLISKNCKRPDRVIKLLNYLSSDEGQIIMSFGVEGDAWEWDVLPGEKGTNLAGEEVIYEKGKIKYTEKAINALSTNTYAATFQTVSGFMSNSVIRLAVSPNGYYIRTFSEYHQYNAKAAIIPYTFKAGLFNVNRDSTAYNYKTIVNKSQQCSSYWIKQLPKIITAGSKDECDSLYYSTLNTVDKYGYKEVLAFDNTCFKNMKVYYGITYAWPPNDPDYVAPKIDIRGYAGEYELEIPEYVAKK